MQHANFIFFWCPPTPPSPQTMNVWEVISSFTMKLLLKLILQNHAFRAMHTWVHFCLTWQVITIAINNRIHVISSTFTVCATTLSPTGFKKVNNPQSSRTAERLTDLQDLIHCKKMQESQRFHSQDNL